MGGEDSNLQGDILSGGGIIYYGQGTTASSTVAPSESLAAWAAFLATATLTSPGSSHTGKDANSTQRSSAGAVGMDITHIPLMVMLGSITFSLLEFYLDV